MHKLILDTDIGTDVDDALALAVLLGSKDINLLGITTVYGDTKLRAQIALHLSALARRAIPTYAGHEKTISGKEVWVTGREGANFLDLDKQDVSATSAIDYLINTVCQNPNQISILAIGPLTNIASAIQKSKKFSENINQLWIMGGDFSEKKVEHNFKCDLEAATIVLTSDIPITILDLPSAQRTIIKMPEIDKIRNSGIFGEILYSEIISWITPRNQDWTIPHDPIAALGIIAPELFEFSEMGRVEISPEGKSIWKLDSTGNVSRISPREPELAVQKMIELIAAN